MPSVKKVDTVILGAGISGLSVGFYLKKNAQSFALLERNKQAGGKLFSQVFNGCTLEFGANSFRGKSDTLNEILAEIRYSETLLTVNKKVQNQYILFKNELTKVPRHPKEFLKTPLLTFLEKVRFFSEFFRTSNLEENPSVFRYFQHRFGTKVAAYFADPFVSGIYSGDSTMLNMSDTFPSIIALEKKFGSVLKGLIQSKATTRQEQSIYSFKSGFSSFINSLEGYLGKNLYKNYPVTSISKRGINYHVSCNDNFHFETKRVISTIPLPFIPSLFQDIFTLPEQKHLEHVSYPSIAVVHSAFPKQSNYKPKGFGYLIPSREKRAYLGCIFQSDIFPKKCNKNQTIYTIFVGGQRFSKEMKENSTKLIQKATRQCFNDLNLSQSPLWIKQHIWEKGIPQYDHKMCQARKVLKKLENKYPNLYFLGNFKGGVSLTDCINNAKNLVYLFSK